jgi:hypothetical protein
MGEVAKARFDVGRRAGTPRKNGVHTRFQHRFVSRVICHESIAVGKDPIRQRKVAPAWRLS